MSSRDAAAGSTTRAVPSTISNTPSAAWVQAFDAMHRAALTRISGAMAVEGSAGLVYAGNVDRPPPDAAKLLVAWMEWERGDTPPGRVLSNLKIAGMREFLEASAEAQADLAASIGQ